MLFTEQATKTVAILPLAPHGVAALSSIVDGQFRRPPVFPRYMVVGWTIEKEQEEARSLPKHPTAGALCFRCRLHDQNHEIAPHLVS
jgi:hypothetical protein